LLESSTVFLFFTVEIRNFKFYSLRSQNSQLRSLGDLLNLEKTIAAKHKQ